MKKIVIAIGYFILASFVGIVDRITKHLAMTLDDSVSSGIPGVSWSFVKNRGISWGMLYADSNFAFWGMAALIFTIIMILAMYTYHRWQSHQSIAGEVLVLSGALSNFVDRMVYAGVIDFIQCSYGRWTFPVFNVADIAIVLGVGIMLVQFWQE